MSLIARNQITIIELLDGEQGPTGPTGPPGEDGGAGETGAAGETKYIWTAYAEDELGTGITTNPAGKSYIGHSYNQSSNVIDIAYPGVFIWTPFYAHLIATKVQITANGAIYSGYDSVGNPPASGKGFHLGPDGLKAKDADLTGTFRSGEGASTGARISAKENIGVGEIAFTGSGLNDLFTPTEGDQAVAIEAKISALNAYTSSYQVEHTYIVGDTGPGGGIICHDKGNWSDGWRYIEVAPKTWNGGSEDPTGRLLTAEATPEGQSGVRSIGYYDGPWFFNSGEPESFIAEMIANHSESDAITLTEACTFGGKTNWILPTIDVMTDYMYPMRVALGLDLSLLDSGKYWSSQFTVEMATRYYVDTELLKASDPDDYDRIKESTNIETAYHRIRPVRKVTDVPMDTITVYYDGMQWRANAGNWSSQVQIIANQSIPLGYGGLAVAFANNSGHTVGNLWSFPQGSLFGLSIKSADGNEYVKASDGHFKVNNHDVLEHDYNGTHPRIISASTWVCLPTAGLLPSVSGAGQGDLGHSAWRFNAVYVNTVYGTTVYGAVGNDIADRIETPEGWKFGYAHIVDGIYYGIPSDTASFIAGGDGSGKMPRVIAGFALVYTDKAYKPGTHLTYRKDGVLIKRRWYHLRKPIVARFHINPTAEIWNEAKVAGRSIVQVVY